MVSTRKKKEQNKKLLGHLSESDADFLIAQSNHEAQTGSRANSVDTNTTLNTTKDPNQGFSSQVDMHTLEENIVSTVRSELDSVMTTVETRVQEAVMTAIEKLVIPGVELAMKSVNALSGHGHGSAMLELDQRYFPEISKAYKRPLQVE